MLTIKDKIGKFQHTSNRHLRNKIFKEIIELYSNDIYYVSKRYEKSIGMDIGDIKSELLILLFMICKVYNMNRWRNIRKFRAYLLQSFHHWAWIKYNQQHNTLKNNNDIISIHRLLNNDNKGGLSIIDTIVDKDAPDIIRETENIDIINNLLNSIDNKYHIIIKMVMHGYTYREIAEKYKLKKIIINRGKAVIKYEPVSVSCIKLILDRKIRPQLTKLYCKK